MENNTARIAKNTLYLYLRSLFVLIVSLYTSRVVLQELGVDDYGIFNVVGGVIGMLEFIRATMQSTFQRYFNVGMETVDMYRLKKIFSTSLSIQLVITIVFILAAETIGLWIVSSQLIIPACRVNAAMWVYQVSIVACSLTFLSTPFCAAITSYEKMGVFAAISMVDAVLKLLICYFITISPFDKLIFYSILLLSINIFDFLLYFLYSLRKLPLTTLRTSWDGNNVKDMLSFSSWTVIDTLAGTLKTQGLNIILNLFFGPVVNAARGIAAQILNAIMQFTNSFQTAFRPQLTKSYASGDRVYMENLYYSATKFSFFLMYVMSLPLIIETPTILSIWLGNNVPEHTISFSRLVLVTAWLGAFANPSTTIAYATGKIKIFSMTASLFNLSILPVAYIVLYLGGSPESSMMVSLTIAILTQIIRILILRKLADLMPVVYLKNVILPCSICCFLSYLTIWFISNIVKNAIVSFITTCMLTVIVCPALIWLFGLNNSEKNILKVKFNQIKSKL